VKYTGTPDVASAYTRTVSIVGVDIPVPGHPFTPGVAMPAISAVRSIPFAVELTAVLVITAVENAGVPATCPGDTHAVCTSSTAFPALADE
jgi:hypothetical protein